MKNFFNDLFEEKLLSIFRRINIRINLRTYPSKLLKRLLCVNITCGGVKVTKRFSIISMDGREDEEVVESQKGQKEVKLVESKGYEVINKK